MSSHLRQELRGIFNGKQESSVRNFIQETCEINNYFERLFKIENNYLASLTELHESLKINFRATYYTNLKEFLIGIGNCKLSLLWSFLNSNPTANISTCLGSIKELQEQNNKFKKDLDVQENDLNWKLTDVSDTQKELIKSYTDLCKNDLEFVEILRKDLEPKEEEKKEEEPKEEEKKDPESSENTMEETKDTPTEEKKVNTLNFNQIEKKSRATALYLERDETQSNIEASGTDFNTSIEKLKSLYKDNSENLASKMQSIYDNMTQSILKFKQEELTHVEHQKEASKGMLEVKYDYSINKDYIPRIIEFDENIDQTKISSMFPNVMKIDNVIEGAKYIVSNMYDQKGNIQFEKENVDKENDPAEVSSLKNQAKNIKDTLKETTNEYKNYATNFFGMWGQKLTTGIEKLGIKKTRGESEDGTVSNNTEQKNLQSVDVKKYLTPVQLNLYEYILEMTDEEKNRDMARVDDILMDFETRITNGEMIRREVVGLFRQKYLGSYTLSYDSFNSLIDVVNVFLKVCFKQNDFLNAVLFYYETQNFHFIKPEPENMYKDERREKKTLIEVLAKENICYMEEFWIALNCHLFRKARHIYNMKEKPDLRFLLTVQSTLKNLKFCKLKLGSEKRFTTVFEKMAQELKLDENEEDKELLDQLKNECLDAWNNIEYGNPMNFEKLQLDKQEQPRLEESKAVENPEFVDHNVLLYLVD